MYSVYWIIWPWCDISNPQITAINVNEGESDDYALYLLNVRAYVRIEAALIDTCLFF